MLSCVIRRFSSVQAFEPRGGEANRQSNRVPICPCYDGESWILKKTLVSASTHSDIITSRLSRTLLSRMSSSHQMAVIRERVNWF